MADLTLTRLPAVAATGIVTFSRFTPDMSALIPAGALVRTADGTQTFAVSVDTAQPSWSATSNGYVVAAGVASLDVPVIAQTPAERRQRAGRHDFPAGIGPARASTPSATSPPFRMASTPSPMMHSGAVSIISSPAGRAPRRLRSVMQSAAFSRG